MGATTIMGVVILWCRATIAAHPEKARHLPR